MAVQVNRLITIRVWLAMKNEAFVVCYVLSVFICVGELVNKKSSTDRTSH